MMRAKKFGFDVIAASLGELVGVALSDDGGGVFPGEGEAMPRSIGVAALASSFALFLLKSPKKPFVGFPGVPGTPFVNIGGGGEDVPEW